MDWLVGEFTIGPAEGGTRWHLAMTEDASLNASQHRELLVREVGPQHQSRSMRNRKRQFCRRDHRLRRDAAGPEHRNFVGLDRPRIAIVGLREIGDPDRLRMAEMNRPAMYRGEPRGDLHGADRVRRLGPAP